MTALQHIWYPLLVEKFQRFEEWKKTQGALYGWVTLDQLVPFFQFLEEEGQVLIGTKSRAEQETTPIELPPIEEQLKGAEDD